MFFLSRFPQLILRVLSCTLALVLIIAQLPTALLAQNAQVESSEPVTIDIEAAMSRADAHIKAREYGKAIEILEGVINQTRANLTRLRDAYILMVQAHVARANSARSSGDFSGEKVWKKSARDWVVECLSLRELRETYPRSEEGLSDQMKPIFDDVRNQLFGALRIEELDPPEATVLLDADTLSVSPVTGLLEEQNIPHGLHILVIQAPGYQTATEDLDIAPGITTDRRYQLKKNKGIFWYASRGLVAAAAVVVGILLIPNPDEEPLPGPPVPPASH